LNFLGMGMPELAVIFLVAFLVLGPSKSIEMARTTGKVLGDLRRTFNDVLAATKLDPEDLNFSDPNATDSKATDSKATGPKSTGNAPTRSGPQAKDSSEDSPDDTAADSSADHPVDFHGADRQ